MLHIAPLARSVDLYDYICVIIAYISTFLVDYKSTINVGNKSWRFIFSDFLGFQLEYIPTNPGDLFSRILARIYSHNYRRSPKYSKIKQQILLYCTISSTTHKICGFYRQETNKSWHHCHHHHHQLLRDNKKLTNFGIINHYHHHHHIKIIKLYHHQERKKQTIHHFHIDTHHHHQQTMRAHHLYHHIHIWVQRHNTLFLSMVTIFV